jgi:glutamine---fructose-6-phosphate transaminase (isomerizing)
LSQTVPYHMLSYILENGSALGRTLREGDDAIHGIAAEARARGCSRIVLSGLGSSYTAAWAAKLAFDELVAQPAYVVPTTELQYHRALLNEATLVVVLSRSGERRRVLDGLSIAQQSGAFTVALTGAADSSMAQAASHSVITAEGPEISFTKTKSVTAGIGVFLSLALAMANQANGDIAALREQLARIPGLIDQALEQAAPGVEQLARTLRFDRLIVSGTGGNAGVAMELALTLQESALITTLWSDTGNLLHGPLCPIDENWLVALLVTPDDVELSQDVFQLIEALGGRTLGLLPRGLSLDRPPHHALPVPAVSERIFWPLVYLPVLQLLAYHCTVSRGLDPDVPAASEVMLEAMLPPGREEPEARLQNAGLQIAQLRQAALVNGLPDE